MQSLPQNLNSLPEDAIRNFLSSFDTVLTDCDGVLWLETEVIEGSQHVINKFIEQGKSVFYVTNNSSKIREEYAQKCKKFGFIASKENIISSAYLAADYLQSVNFNKKVYVLGTEGIVKELQEVGVQCVDHGPETMTMSVEEFVAKELSLDPEVGAVLQGFDPQFSYPKLARACLYLEKPDMLFLATCPDETFRFSSTILLPGTGALLNSLETASGRKAEVLGKPNDYIKECITRKQNIEPSRTLMIGDRLNTDVLFGNRCGFQTLFVLTGVAKVSDMETYTASKNPSDRLLVPQFYVQRLGDLLPYM